VLSTLFFSLEIGPRQENVSYNPLDGSESFLMNGKQSFEMFSVLSSMSRRPQMYAGTHSEAYETCCSRIWKLISKLPKKTQNVVLRFPFRTYTMLLNSASALNRAFQGHPGAPGGASYIRKHDNRRLQSPPQPRRGGRWSLLVFRFHMYEAPRAPGGPRKARFKAEALLSNAVPSI
jgi:hypothetical protein